MLAKTNFVVCTSPFYTRRHRSTHDVTVLHTTSLFYTRRHCSTHDVTVLHTTLLFYIRRHCCTHNVTVLHTTSHWRTRGEHFSVTRRNSVNGYFSTLETYYFSSLSISAVHQRFIFQFVILLRCKYPMC